MAKEQNNDKRNPITDPTQEMEIRSAVIEAMKVKGPGYKFHAECRHFAKKFGRTRTVIEKWIQNYQRGTSSSAPLSLAPSPSAPSPSAQLTSAPPTSAQLPSAAPTSAQLPSAPLSSASISSAQPSSVQPSSAQVPSAPSFPATISSAQPALAPPTSVPSSSAPLSSAQPSSAPSSLAPLSSAQPSSAPSSLAPLSSAPLSSAQPSSAPSSSAHQLGTGSPILSPRPISPIDDEEEEELKLFSYPGYAESLQQDRKRKAEPARPTEAKRRGDPKTSDVHSSVPSNASSPMDQDQDASRYSVERPTEPEDAVMDTQQSPIDEPNAPMDTNAVIYFPGASIDEPHEEVPQNMVLSNASSSMDQDQDASRDNVERPTEQAETEQGEAQMPQESAIELAQRIMRTVHENRLRLSCDQSQAVQAQEADVMDTQQSPIDQHNVSMDTNAAIYPPVGSSPMDQDQDASRHSAERPTEPEAETVQGDPQMPQETDIELAQRVIRTVHANRSRLSWDRAQAERGAQQQLLQAQEADVMDTQQSPIDEPNAPMDTNAAIYSPGAPIDEPQEDVPQNMEPSRVADERATEPSTQEVIEVLTSEDIKLRQQLQEATEALEKKASEVLKLEEKMRKMEEEAKLKETEKDQQDLDTQHLVNAITSPDAAISTPDAAFSALDAAVSVMDAVIASLDASVASPGTSVVSPDAVISAPDASVAAPLHEQNEEIAQKPIEEISNVETLGQTSQNVELENSVPSVGAYEEIDGRDGILGNYQEDVEPRNASSTQSPPQSSPLRRLERAATANNHLAGPSEPTQEEIIARVDSESLGNYQEDVEPRNASSTPPQSSPIRRMERAATADNNLAGPSEPTQEEVMAMVDSEIESLGIRETGSLGNHQEDVEPRNASSTPPQSSQIRRLERAATADNNLAGPSEPTQEEVMAMVDSTIDRLVTQFPHQIPQMRTLFIEMCARYQYVTSSTTAVEFFEKWANDQAIRERRNN